MELNVELLGQLPNLDVFKSKARSHKAVVVRPKALSALRPHLNRTASWSSESGDAGEECKEVWAAAVRTSLVKQPKRQCYEEEEYRGKHQTPDEPAPPPASPDPLVSRVMVSRVMQFTMASASDFSLSAFS